MLTNSSWNSHSLPEPKMPFDAFIVSRYSCKIMSDESLMIYYVKDMADHGYRYYIFNEGGDSKFEVMFDEEDLPDVFHKIMVRCLDSGVAYLPNGDIKKQWTNYGPYLMKNDRFTETMYDNTPRFSIKYTCKNNIEEEEENYMDWLNHLVHITRK